MSRCSFEKLLSLLDRQLDLDGQVEVLDHIDRCSICHEAVYSIIRDRESSIYNHEPPPGCLTHSGRHADL